VRDVWHVRGLPNLDPLLVAVLLLVIIVINTHGAGAAHHQRLRSTPTMVVLYKIQNTIQFVKK